MAVSQQILDLLKPDARLEEREVASTTVFDGKIFTAKTLDVVLPDGTHGYREIVSHLGGAGVAAVRDGKICLVRQWRVAPGSMQLEIPAGKIEAGEDPAVCAARELEEEAGLVADELVLLANSYGAVGFTSEMTRVYLARGLSRHEAHPDEGEFVDVVWVPLEDAAEAIRAGVMCDSKTIVAVMTILAQGLC